MTDNQGEESAKMKQIQSVEDLVLVISPSTAGCTALSQAVHEETANIPLTARLKAADTARLAYYVQRLQMIVRARTLSNDCPG